MRPDNLYSLPADLPIPVDDGACDHLPGTPAPSVKLKSTADRTVDLAEISQTLTIIYCYPRTGAPDRDPLGGLEVWNAIPGARGCTLQACDFRDHHQELQALGAQVFGLSAQTTEYQREMVGRLHLPFEVLSDEELRLAKALRLPMFKVEGQELIKRLTLVLESGKITKVFYPVFPPDNHAEEVIGWLTARAAKQSMIPHEYTFRSAIGTDVAKVTALVNAAYGDYVQRIGMTPRPMTDDYAEVIKNYRVTVAESQKTIVGVVVLTTNDEGFLIDNVAVDPSHRGKGLGKALLDFAEAEARRAGFDSIYLYTHEKMTENLALYSRIGYVEYDRRSQGEFSLVYLRKRLE